MKSTHYNFYTFLKQWVVRCGILILVAICAETKAQNQSFAIVYVDETEVDVASWLSFYSWTIIHEGYDKAQLLLPDSTKIEPELWRFIKTQSDEDLNVNAKYSGYPIGYFKKECQSNEKYKRRLDSEGRYCNLLNFPITGISYEQTLLFCKWRTQVQGNNMFVFQLPSSADWQKIAMSGLSDSEQQNGCKDSIYKVKSPNYNYSFKNLCQCAEAGTLFGTGMFYRDKNKAFDVFGNVSEMTSEKGIAKGGNFLLYANQCHPDSIQYYEGPQSWLGFRCVARVQKQSSRTNLLEEISYTSDSGRFGQLIDPRDQKMYPTVIVGKQTWMAKNLAYKPDSGKYWVYENNEENADKYGYLYTSQTSGNVCPAGWHLPSKDEFETLLNELDTSGGESKYSQLRPSGASGMSIIDCAVRIGMNFTSIEGAALFWTSTPSYKKYYWIMSVNGFVHKVLFFEEMAPKSGLSVRCVKDAGNRQ